MRKAFLHVMIPFLVLLYGCGPALPKQNNPAEHESPASRLLFQARQILSTLTSTRYSHKTRVDENTGLYCLDCSALACYLLGRAAPESLTSVPVDSGHRHARAKNFYDTFSKASTRRAKNGWQQVARLLQAEPGDFIAWRKDPLPQKGDTGHIVMILEKPVLEKDGAVRIIALDAARSGHALDTRKKGTGGVGFGCMWFKVDRAGAPVAFYWSDRKKRPATVPVAIGRAMGAPHWHR